MKLSIKKFKCICGQVQEHIVWDNEEKTGAKCVNIDCKKELLLSQEVQQKKPPKSPGIRTPTKNRV